LGAPKISLLEKKPLIFYLCEMCRERTRKNKFSWKSWFTGNEIVICRECAYRESFGTKKMNKAKSNRILEEKKINK
jgi:hypothetical protein